MYVHHGGEKMVPDPLEQELQKGVSCHVGAGDTISILCKSKCS